MFTTSSASTWKEYEESEGCKSLTEDDVTASRSLVMGVRNHNMDVVALWIGMTNTVFGVMCKVIF